MYRPDRQRRLPSRVRVVAGLLLALPLLAGSALARADAAKGGKTPEALLGKWGFTSISGTTYWDKATGAYLGDGAGGSQTYTFEPDGRYQMFNYAKTRTYNWQIQTLTWEEGTVSFEGDRLTLRPTSGRYQVIDNQVARNNYKRPMRDDELKKNVRTYYWSLARESDGKPALLMGIDQDKLVHYRLAER